MATWNGQVRNRSVSYLTEVLKADPDFYAKRRDELLYEFSNGREFRGDPRTTATAYTEDE